jgi:hypothetical protein
MRQQFGRQIGESMLADLQTQLTIALDAARGGTREWPGAIENCEASCVASCEIPAKSLQAPADPPET